LTGPEYLTECLKALGHLDNTGFTSKPSTLGTAEDSLTAFVDANRTSGTDIVELSPVKRPHSPDVKAETLSPRKPLRLTKSMPEGLYDGLSRTSQSPSRAIVSYDRPATGARRRSEKQGAEGRRSVMTSTTSSDRVLYIKRRCFEKSFSTTSGQDVTAEV
jgi:hypothetical protein